VGKAGESRFAHLKGGLAEMLIDKKSFVRSLAKDGRIKVELKSGSVFVKTSGGSGIEAFLVSAGRKRFCPLDLNGDIGLLRFDAKRNEGGHESGIDAALRRNFYRHSANTEPSAMLEW
jgi:hypothetical protein